MRLWLDLLVMGVLAIIGIYALPDPSMHGMGVFCLAVSGLFAVFLFAVFFVIPRLIFRGQPRFRDEYTLIFTNEDIHFRTQNMDSRLQWSLYTHALVDARSCILYYGKRQFTVIPVRVFENAEKLRAFDQMLSKHVRPIIRKK